MVRYLDNAQSAIDKNIVEREHKGAVMGRKAWLFGDTPAGMHANAVLYSLVQTCLANGIDPYRYLVTVIERFPAMRTGDEVQALLPWALKSELMPEATPLKLAARAERPNTARRPRVRVVPVTPAAESPRGERALARLSAPDHMGHSQLHTVATKNAMWTSAALEDCCA